MAKVSNEQSEIIRTERGLTILGTRITLYDVMDFIKAEYPPRLIRDKFNLTDRHINAALSYIEANHSEVEAEYQEVLKTREEIRQYWEKHNQEHLDRIAKTPRNPKQKALWEKLESQKTRNTNGIL